MNERLSLALELLGQDPESLLFRVQFRNQSSETLLFPWPEITGIHFGNKGTLRESEWYTALLVQAFWRGFVLVPGGERAFEFRVRPSTIDWPEEDDRSDFYRWCVELPPAEYLVWFQFAVGQAYFCPDSHYRYPDLVREAEARLAEVWTGEVKSNRLHLVRTAAAGE